MEKNGIFETTSSFNKLLNSKVIPKQASFNGVFSWDNLTKKINDGAYVINLDEYADVGTHWIGLFCTKIEIVCFGSFGVEYVPEEIKEFIEHKNIKVNIFRVKANNSIIWGYFCSGLIDFMLPGKKVTDFTSSFSPQTLKKMIV